MKLPNTEAGLLAVIEAARAKIRDLRDDKDKRVREYGDAVLKRAKAGNKVVLLAKPLPQKLYVSHGKVGSATRSYHDLEVGTTLKLDAVQPRAGRIWATDGKHSYCFESYTERALIDVYPDELSAQVAYAAKRGPVFEL